MILFRPHSVKTLRYMKQRTKKIRIKPIKQNSNYKSKRTYGHILNKTWIQNTTHSFIQAKSQLCVASKRWRAKDRVRGHEGAATQRPKPPPELYNYSEWPLKCETVRVSLLALKAFGWRLSTIAPFLHSLDRSFLGTHIHTVLRTEQLLITTTKTHNQNIYILTYISN